MYCMPAFVKELLVDELDKISEAYKEDFKRYDYEIIENIPLILREAEKYERGKA